MYDINRNRFQAMTYAIPLLFAHTLAFGQVQVSGSASYVRSIVPGQNLGEERFDLLGIGLDPDDGTRFLVCRTNSMSACPSPDSIHVYRHETSTNQWVFDGSIDHPGAVYESIVDVDGDRIAIGQDFFGGSIGNDSADVYKRGAGGVWMHEGTLRPADNFVGDFFGYSVSLDGDLLAVGAPQEGDDPRASQVGPGSVYVFQFTNGSWIQTDKVIAADGIDRDYFGNEIDIIATPDGWRMLVAAPDASGDPSGFNMAGAVYLLEKSMGSIAQLDKRVRSVDPQVSGDYGDGGVALEGDLAAIVGEQCVDFLTISASGQLVPISNTSMQGTEFSRPDIENRVISVGLPYVSTPSVFLMRVPAAGAPESLSIPLPAGLVPLDGFGRIVRSDGEYIATGVSGLDLTGENAGGIWTQPIFAGTAPSGLLTEGGTAPNARQGDAIAASDEWIAIGSPGEQDACNPDASGSVRMLRTNSGEWVTTEIITPEPGVNGSGYGAAIAINVDTMAITMPGYIGELFFTENGAVMMYERSGSRWVLTQTLEGNIAGEGFGESVALYGDRLVVGQPLSSGGGWAVQFTRDTNGVWQRDSSFSLEGLAPDARFGAAMTMSSDRLYIATPNDQGGAGSVVVYSLSNNDWVYLNEVPIPSPLPGDHAGEALAQNDDHLFVGLPGNGSAPGRVAVYPKQGGALGTPTVLNDPVVGFTGFGAHIETNGALLAVGYSDPAESPLHLFAFNGSSYQLLHSIPTRSAASGSMFGSALAFGANTLLIGAPGEDAGGERGSGLVHLYKTELKYTVPECDMAMQNDRIQWIQDETPENGEWFAYSIEVDDGYAISGVPFENYSFVYNGSTFNANNAGKAVIFERTGLREWTQVAQFRGGQVDTNPMPGINSDWMGFSVDIKGDVAAAGGTQAYDEQNAKRSGSVQVYERTETGWARTTELFPSNNGVSGAPQIFDFGSAVGFDSSGSKLAIGARNSSVPITGTGAAFVYERSNGQWVESNLLLQPNAQFADHVGDSIAVEEDWVAVGSPDDHSGAGGAVHLFRRDALGSWVYHSTILSPTNHPSSRFGISLELSRSDLGLTLVVGASTARSGFANSVGAAFVFVYDNNLQQWSLVQRLDPELPRTSTSYGTDVGIDHNTIAVGGPFIQDTPQGTHWTGGVEVYNLDLAQAQFQRRIVIRPDQTEWGTANGWGNSVGLSGGTVFLGTRFADGDPYDPLNTNRNWGAMIAYDIICVPECPADLNGDGMLDFFDVSLFLGAYQSMDPLADINGDGLLDFFDVSAFLIAFNAGC